MTVSPIMSMDALAAPVEETIIHQKFGEMELPEDEETEDVDYSPSDAESDDSLEWASETERTKAEDALVEGKVGIDFYGAAMAVATEPYSPEQEFGEMTLSDYDSNEDADYAPNDSDTSSDELEY